MVAATDEGENKVIYPVTVILGIRAPFTLRHVFLLFQLAFGILRRALREGKRGDIFSGASGPYVSLGYFLLLYSRKQKKKKK